MAFKGTEGEVISLDTASGWTANWRGSKDESDPNAIFYGKDKIKAILDQEGCMGLRIYFGIDDDGQKVLILVGADANEDDQEMKIILDRGVNCPPQCGSSNGLNS